MRIERDGNVGIGTTSPSQKLTVNGDVGVTTGNQLFVNDIAAYTGAMIIGPTGASELKFRTAGSEKMRITSAGNVGIGTTSPQNPLHVNGSLRIGPFLTPDRDGFVFIPGGSLNTIQANNENTNFDNNQGNIHIRTINNSSATPVERITILSTGNVGIGTTNPGEKLDIVGKQIFSGVGSNQYGNPGAFNTASNGDKIIFYNDGASYDGRIGVGNASNLWLKSYGETPSEGDIEFYAGGSRRAIIKGTGNVGIGTNNPGKKLEVDGTFKATGDTSVDGTGNLFIRNRLATGSGIVFIDNVWQGGIEHNSGNLYFRTGGQVDRMTIKTNGNVGIGTTSPQQKLHVNSGSANEVARFESTDGTAYLSIMDNNTSNSLQGIGSTGNNLTFYSNNAERMRIADSGNVGIGDTNPTMRLKVVDSTAGVLAAFTNSSSSGAGIQITAGNGTNNSLQIRNYAGGELMRVQGNGRVGIGTTTPGAKLSVNGNVKIEGTNSLLFGGSASIPSWAINHNGSDLLIDDQGGNIGSVLFNNAEGVALPRLTTTQINAISLPAQGLMAYNTTLNTICFYNGSSWQKVSHANM